ncbi:hypothetical protein MLD38_003528 [Melastoma candidum]|uniref:Uncharacterized protein n=1 Tax=Melastoma candidum TaxID=119954 RepID=A0ACB9S4U8_9MYRT|nr:hypothetical protein MLD38_003528 [Melastoma candidum]
MASTFDDDPFYYGGGTGFHFDSDLDFAFRLQLQEAITASLATAEASSSGPSASVTAVSDIDGERGLFRVYCKGFAEDGGELGERAVFGIGVAVCDESGGLVVGVKRGKVIHGGASRKEAEATAVVEGMTKAVELGLRRVVFYTDYHPLYQFVTHKWQSKQRKVENLVNQVDRLSQSFRYFRFFLVARSDLRFAVKLARDAISDNSESPTEPECGSSNDNSRETCDICLEDTVVAKMFSVDECQHRYCLSCMKQHVEVKLLHGVVPKCPHEGCKSDLSVSSCSKFLTPKLMNTMAQRIKEASIPVSEKVYCPYPKCSALMSKKEIGSSSRNVVARKCTECHRLFCIDCKVPWHCAMTCIEYKRLNPDPPLNDARLKSLAKSNLWRQCEKCSHMIELAEGCYHMTCRCGYEFCYNCGAEWKDKKATCDCPLWEEEYILQDGSDNELDDDDDDDYDDDYDEEEYEYDEEDEIYNISVIL